MLEYILRWVAILIMFILNTSLLYYSLYVTRHKTLKILLLFLYIIIIVVISLSIIYLILVRKYM